MNNKEYLWFLAFGFLIQSANSQNIENVNRSLQDFSSEIHFRNSGTSESHTKIDGSEFLDEHFVNGEIFTTKSEHYSDIPMRYNVYRDKIEVKLDNGNIYDLTDHSMILKILLNKRTLIYTKFDAGKIKTSGYLFVLYSGKSSLYSRNTKEFVKAVEETDGIRPAIPAKIVDKQKEYYIKLADGIPRIFGSKKDLLSLLSNHASEVEDFIKKDKLKLNNEDDLIKIMSYFDTL